jgi:flagellar motility protein MotE (MotC chaperone)
MICLGNAFMPTNFYETAREQACREIADIDSQVLGLAHRKSRLKKLIELLGELESEPQQGSADGVISVVPTPDQPIAAEVLTTDVATELASAAAVPETPVAESVGPETPTLAAHLEKLHEYEQSQARIVSEAIGDTTAEEAHTISHEQIAELAYLLWIDRGYAHGHHQEDWLRAEAELRG